MNLEGMHHYVARQELRRLIKDLEPEALDPAQQKEQALALWKRRLQPVRVGHLVTSLTCLTMFPGAC